MASADFPDTTRFGFTPRLPDDLTGMRFRMILRGALVEVSLQPGRATYTLIEGERVTFAHEGAELELTAGQRVELPITPR